MKVVSKKINSFIFQFTIMKLNYSGLHLVNVLMGSLGVPAMILGGSLGSCKWASKSNVKWQLHT